MGLIHTANALTMGVLCLALSLGSAGEAQETFEIVPADTNLRDVAVDATQGMAYFAAYGREEVWKVDLRTREVVARVPAGRGPAHLALSADGRYLACVNRLSRDVLVYDAGAMSSLGTFACGEGASEVTGLDNGVFAVVNSFADSITVIDVPRGETALIEDIGRVPNGAAYSEGILAVTTRLPSSVILLDVSQGFSNPPRARVELPATPVGIASEPQGRFVVATETGVVRIDGATRQISARGDFVPRAVAACGGRIWALSGDELAELDASLQVTARFPLGLEATRLGCSGAVVALVAPAGEAWLVASALEPGPSPMPEYPAGGQLEPITPPPVQVAPMEPRESPSPSEPEPSTPMLPAEPEPPRESEPGAAPRIVEAEPVQTGRSEVSGPGPAPAVRNREPDANASAHSESPQPAENRAEQHEPPGNPETYAEAGADQDARVERGEESTDMAWSPYAERPSTLPAIETRAPEFTREAPPPAPLADVWPRSLTQAVAQGWDFGALRGAFEDQDWEQPLEFRDVTADRFRGTRDAAGRPRQLIFQGNVSWDWAESAFTAQRLEADLGTREITIEEVRLEKELSSLDADRLYYRYPEALDEATLPLLEARDLSEQERARRLYTMGYGEADNFVLVEPFRELHAEYIEYDLAERIGYATGVRGRLDVLHFGVEKLEMRGPDTAYAEDAWITPCPGDPPLFRLRLREIEFGEDDTVVGRKARVQIGRVMTPIYWPRWTFRPGMDTFIDIDFDSGRAAQLGYYVNYGQRFAVNRNVEAGFRLLPTEKEGVGFGIEGSYDFMTTPSALLFRGQGDYRTMLTTKERGYAEMYHRHELTEDDVLLLQSEYWGDRDIIKDFYYGEYRHRTEPRTFANVTRTRPGYIATATLRHNTHGFGAETERLPEVTYHLLDRQLARRLYVSFDTVAGHNERKPYGPNSWRMVNVGRAHVDLELGDALGIVPFYEADLSWYSKTIDDGDSDARFSNIAGVTAQSRFHRAYPGTLGFSGFKHVIVPSVTFSYRPKATLRVDETPRFDMYDNVYGRSRIESKIGNMVFGRDALTGEVWQVARLSLYHGDDFWNEIRRASHYEAELDLRPRPWWGILTVAERHSISREINLDEPFLFERLALQFWEEITGEPFDPELAFRYNALYADYDRILSYLYYDDLAQGGRFGARLGYAYTKTQDRMFNQEILYGARYKLSEFWAFAFEHRYDIDRDSLYHQEYEIRKRFRCFDWSIRVRDRRQGWDLNFTVSLSAFPGTRVKF